MTTIHNGYIAQMRMVFRLFQIVALAGLLLSTATLVGTSAPFAEWRQALYITWFLITIVSIEAILHWVKAGVYALGFVTLCVTIVDLVEGVATVGGASLGLLVAVLLYTTLQPVWEHFD